MRFPTVYSARESVFSETGSRVKPLYSPSIKADGSFDLEVVGKIDIYDEIQSHADSVDLIQILDRFARGDVQALARRQGLYGDFTAMPKTYADMLNVMIKAQAEFEALPVETKQKFDNDVHKFISRMDDLEFMRTVFPPVENPAPAPADESRKDGE